MKAKVDSTGDSTEIRPEDILTANSPISDIKAVLSLEKANLQTLFTGVVVEKPKFKISKVTQSGVIHVTFNNKMKVAQIDSRQRRRSRRQLGEDEQKQTIYQELDQEIIQVSLLKNTEGQFDESDSFEWELDDYEEYLMKIKLIFDDPMTVSASGLDRIRVSFKDTALIYDYFGQEIEKDSFVEKLVPRQFAN